MKIVCAIGFGGLTEMYWSCQYLSIDPKKSLPHNHILRSRVGGAFPFRFAVCKQQSEIEIRHLPVISKYGFVGRLI